MARMQWTPALWMGLTWALSGCLILSTGGSNRGQVNVGWTFNGQADCAAAGVSKVQLTLDPRNSAGVSVSPILVDCTDHAFTISGVHDGDYTLTMDGVNSTNLIIYTTTQTVLVTAGGTTAVGVVNLTRLLGEMTVDWQFAAVGGVTQDCARAGVDDVQVVLVDDSSATVFDHTTPCHEGPASVAQLVDGNYTISLYGLHYYNSVAVPLYEITNLPFTISRGSSQNLGVQQLAIQAAEFGSFNVSWRFPGNQTCASTGVTNVHVVIYPAMSTTAEDTFDTPCENGSSLQHTFVPGDWRLVGSAVSAGGTAFNAEVTQNVAPRQTVSVPLNLVQH